VHAVEIRRSVAQIHEYFSGDAEVTINLAKDQFLGTITGQVDCAEAIEKGLITVDGDASLVPRFFASFDRPTETPVLVVR
jgi:alkyl sulfatase BDS1-like metallo-beta-lactamase superfamily hydrolase